MEKIKIYYQKYFFNTKKKNHFFKNLDIIAKTITPKAKPSPKFTEG